MNLRPASAILGTVLERDAGPLGRPRAPQDRMVGVCRHFATLYAALLRHRGTPARARCGFGGYFVDVGVGGGENGKGEWIDHWVTEYWDDGRGRWVRADPQFDETMLARLAVTEDPADLRPEAFLTGGDAWLGHRWGSYDAQRFGIGELRGPWFVAGNVVRDLAALNKVEVLPWDVWGPLGAWIEDGPDDELVDALAVAATSGSLEDVRAAYRSHPWLPVSEGASELVPVRDA
jgi:transglutaminase-like putative cysteine protease